MKIFISLLIMVFALGFSQGSMAHGPEAKHKMASDAEAKQMMEHKAVPDEMKLKREMGGKPKAEMVESSVAVPAPKPKPKPVPPTDPDCEEGTDPDCDTDDDEDKDVDTDGLRDSAAELMSPG